MPFGATAMPGPAGTISNTMRSGSGRGLGSTGSSKPIAAASAVILSGADIERIRRTAHTSGDLLSMKSVEEEKADALKEQRKAMSNARTARFPNTLAAMRKRKHAAREERLAAEEAERVKLDRAEDALRQQERLRVLEAANATLIENTDRMKMLRSKALNSYVNDVREHQIDLKKRKDEMEKEDAAAEHVDLMRRLEAMENAEAQRAAEAAARRADVTREQRRQLEDFILRKVKEIEDERAEGRRIAREAELAVQAEAEERQRRRDAQIRANYEMKLENQKLLAAKHEADVRAREEAERLEAYVAAKQKEAETKAALIEAKRQEAARKARAIAEKVQSEFSAKMSNEEERVAAAVAEADAKSKELEAYRKGRQLQMHKDIAEHRLQTQRKREQEAADARRAAAEEAARFAANVKALEDAESAERTERKMRARIVQSYHLAQMADKKRTVEGTAENEREIADLAGSMSAGVQISEAFSAFTAAADALLREEERKGHKTLGLRRAIVKSTKDPLIAATAIM